ncbi:MAG: hypothetical protein HY670_08355 [Chloroflexi bacterium]|nr:hypothetical protein [Chloroflexota bacterium]
MKSEALRNIGTMRQVRTSLDIARGQRCKTTNSLSRTKDEVQYLEHLADKRLPQLLEKERRQFGAQEAAIEKSRQQVLKAREKLAVTVNRNRALGDQRRQLQKSRWGGEGAALPKTETPAIQPGLRQMELTY